MSTLAERCTLAGYGLLEAEHLLGARRISDALRAYDRAEAADADADRCGAGRWLAAMLLGEFEWAWRQSDAIRERGAPDRHRFWNGESIRGVRVIVRCLHGLGDAVQMLRYLPMLNRAARRTILEVPPRLLPLARWFDGVNEVIPWKDPGGSDAAHWDVQVEIMELPYLFRTTPAELPLAARYLLLPGDDVKRTAFRMGDARRRRVGVVWSCGEWNPQRSIPLALLAPMLSSNRFEFWNLQGGRAAAEARDLPMRDATGECGDGLLALASTIANLDLVITTDTLAAHLAGALGKPAWIMLQHAADWRWMIDRPDSPWYPASRLFRQREPGDWRSVVEAMNLGLAKLDD